MDAINQLGNVDFPILFTSIFIVVAGFKAFVTVFEWLFNKLGIEFKWMRVKREDHELLVTTVANLCELQKKESEDASQSVKHDKKIKEDLSNFTSDIHDSIKETQDMINQFTENRIHDREQSYSIQKELTDAITKVANQSVTQDARIEALILATKELLADKINQKYKHYIELGGIPEDEVNEFTNLHNSYHTIGGNSSGDAKYNYVMNRMPVLPSPIHLE